MRRFFLAVGILAITSALASAQAVVQSAAPLASQTSVIAPGELSSIYGSGFCTCTTALSNFTAPPTSLGGASVSIGGTAAPITFNDGTQLDVQVPFSVSGSVVITVQPPTARRSTRAPSRWPEHLWG